MMWGITCFGVARHPAALYSHWQEVSVFHVLLRGFQALYFNFELRELPSFRARKALTHSRQLAIAFLDGGDALIGTDP